MNRDYCTMYSWLMGKKYCDFYDFGVFECHQVAECPEGLDEEPEDEYNYDGCPDCGSYDCHDWDECSANPANS